MVTKKRSPSSETNTSVSSSTPTMVRVVINPAPSFKLVPLACHAPALDFEIFGVWRSVLTDVAVTL